jgi:Uma2 family endonuclease
VGYAILEKTFFYSPFWAECGIIPGRSSKESGHSPMATPKSKNPIRITPEEYLERERASLDQKHEYVDGEIFAMVGASLPHNVISGNIFALLWTNLSKAKCRPLINDMKVRNEAKDSFFYPDILVYCGKPLFHDEEKDVLINPTVIFEVLSPSTMKYDKGEKFYRYRQIPSLQSYLIVSQDTARVEHYERQESQWSLIDVSGLEKELSIKSVGVCLTLSEIYARAWEE